MKYKFEASGSLYDLHTQQTEISVNDFVSLLATSIFTDKKQTCTFEVTNYEASYMLNCTVDVPVVKKVFLNMFQESEKKRKPLKKKRRRKQKRWISNSPKRRRRRWVSPQGRRESFYK